jgi:phage-related holin
MIHECITCDTILFEQEVATSAVAFLYCDMLLNLKEEVISIALNFSTLGLQLDYNYTYTLSAFSHK